jgi:hypothetical protein
MRRLVFAVVSCLLFAVPALAQTNPVQAGQAFTVAFDHDGQNVTGFQCNVDGKPLGSVLAATARACAIPGQAVGVHTVTVTSINAFNTATSPALTATAGTGPTAPSNLRLSVTQVTTIEVLPDGSVKQLAQSSNVERLP